MAKEISRCTGHCCRDFTLPFSPMELSFMRKQISKGRTRIIKEGGRPHKTIVSYDVNNNKISQIANMVIFRRAFFPLSSSKEPES